VTDSSLGIWLVREEALELGTWLQDKLGGELFTPWRQQSSQTQRVQFRTVFFSRSHWVLIMATGIAMRFMDGLPQHKLTDPGIVVLDEAGRFAIPLLSGHEGGANALAWRIANLINAIPVITTATETLKPLVVGIGCRKGVTARQVETAVLRAMGERHIDEIREVATIDLKAEEPGLLSFCEEYGLPLRIIRREAIAARSWVSRPSAWVEQNIGVVGVCEPSALIASPRGKLLVPKTACDGVTVAIVDDGMEQLI
jgi:cobalt-precorrin 5A hydrolase